ncbi:DUF6247 family protein [Thermomonospora umbrina]|uniref:Uncharacterized protein n=1 Tax=Thermomonospora umbrina TaxID=111806 RepID=A0A3D9SJ96_9ACTN|nr:DUF6247 family protein [Thermomonospora umbrina]REE95777.1 hypothetical protein DFJ69_1188 [Thermomonospora umbrina]
MTAEPIGPGGPNPEDIMRRLPADERDRFERDYHDAVDAAHEPGRYGHLQDVVRRWHLRAEAHTHPDFTARPGTGDPATFIQDLDEIPGWPGRADTSG